MINTLQKKPKIIQLTETWIGENDAMDHQYDLQVYQPNRFFARTESKRRSGGVAFYFENSVKNKALKNVDNLECSLFKVQLDDFNTMNFCRSHRTDSVKLNYFF